MKEALQLILDQALAAAQVDLKTSIPTALVPGSAKVVDMERYAEGRARFRGDLRTKSLPDFSKYVERRAAKCTGYGFVDQDSMSAVVFFNLGDSTDPGHADDRATLCLKPTAAFAAMKAIAGKALDQKSLSDWIEDWRHLIKATTANEQEQNLVATINAVRNITVKAASEREHQVGDFSASMSAMEQIEAQSREILPSALHFSCVPYEGLVQRVISLRLSVITSGEKPVLKLRWVGEEAQRDDIAQEFKAVLERDVGGFASLIIGTFDPGQ